MKLKYGSISLDADIPPEHLAGVIEPSPLKPEKSAEELIASALLDCDASISTFSSEEKVVIVTSDITRYTGSEIYLPMIVDRLSRQGIADSGIEILIALGIHRRQTEEEHAKILGALYGRIKVSDHDCDDPSNLRSIGRTSNGIEVRINRRAVEADRLVLTGGIGFHYFAGFSGGRKSVLPGIASREACMASHFSVLNPLPGSGRNRLAATGNLNGNPVHLAMVEACEMANPAFILNTVVSPEKRIAAAFAGDWRKAHQEGCSFCRENFACNIGEKRDMILVSCGGFPKDINFIQAHKAMEYASHAVKEGGVMILLAECRDGFGNATFFDWFRHRELDSFEDALRRNYQINGQTAYSAFDKARRFRVILVSGLDSSDVERMGMIPASSVDEAMRIAERHLPSGWRGLVMPEGGSVLPLAK